MGMLVGCAALGAPFAPELALPAQAATPQLEREARKKNEPDSQSKRGETPFTSSTILLANRPFRSELDGE
jgi:hypothetical protein